jgi:hypothetical protein
MDEQRLILVVEDDELTRVLALLRGSASGRVSGAPPDFALANCSSSPKARSGASCVFVDRDEAKAAANAR